MSRDQQPPPQPAVRALAKHWTKRLAAVRNGACGWSSNPEGARLSGHADPPAQPQTTLSIHRFCQRQWSSLHMHAPPTVWMRTFYDYSHRKRFARPHLPAGHLHPSSEPNELFAMNDFFHSQGFCLCWGRPNCETTFWTVQQRWDVKMRITAWVMRTTDQVQKSPKKKKNYAGNGLQLHIQMFAFNHKHTKWYALTYIHISIYIDR